MPHARKFSYRSLAVLGFLSLLGALLAVSPAYAAPKPPKGSVDIAYTATVTSVQDSQGLVSGVHVGDVITGRYSYDLATPDTNELAEVGDYWHTSKKKFGMTVNLGQFTTQTDPKNPNFLVEIIDNYQDRDNYLLRSYNNTSTGPAVGHISWQLDDSTQTALTSPALPTEPPVLSAWELGSFHVQCGGGNPDRGFLIVATVTEVQKV